MSAHAASRPAPPSLAGLLALALVLGCGPDGPGLDGPGDVLDGGAAGGEGGGASAGGGAVAPGALPDAGPWADAGADGGAPRPDAGRADAGGRTDGGRPDGGAPHDAGAPATCSGTSAWTCAATSRTRCVDGGVRTEACAAGCLPAAGADALCIEPGPGWPCASSQYQGAQYWTCSQGALHECSGTTPLRVDCPHGCALGPAGTNDACNAPPPAGTTVFGFPVGDRTTGPAGGWFVSQVLGHYLNAPPFVGGHLAEDIFSGAESTTANAPVYAVADGTVRYAGPNSSTYKHVVLIEHALGGGKTLCSFYGHLQAPTVASGAKVKRGELIARVLDWNATFGGANSHLHYVLLTKGLCDASAAASGALVCGYDQTSSPNGIVDLASEPATYTSVGDVCGNQQFGAAFVAPSQYIQAHHF